MLKAHFGRQLLWLAMPVVFILISGTARFVSAAESPRPNVLFIVTDDMNNDLGCYGNSRVHSPHIDALAKRGMQFDRAYCQVTVCNPSRVSMLSGLRPDNTQVYTLLEETRSHLGDWTMLPEYFRKQGYLTAGIGKIYHTNVGFEDPRSWDIEVPAFGKHPPEEEIILGDDPDGPGEHSNDWYVLKTPDEKTPDGIVARKGVEIMEQAVSRDEPFFVAVGFRRPHAPFAAPKKYFDMYPINSIDLPLSVPEGYYESLPSAVINYPAPEKPLTEKEQRELIAAYYACNSFIDAQVGVLVDAVDRLGIGDHTIIVFVSDHGYHLGDHGGFWHKLTLFEESARVPLIIWAPGMKAAGQKTDRLVELIDLYPTLVALAGLPERENLDGINLTNVLNNPNAETKPAAYTMLGRSDDPNANPSKSNEFQGRSVRTDRYRYTEWDEGRRGIELYDHQDDPRELVNLSEQPEASATKKVLHELLNSPQEL